MASKARKNEKLSKEARTAADKWRNVWLQNINQYHYMHEFVFGAQWTDDEEEMLKTYRKVPMMSNKLGVMANILIGEQQQNTPQLQVVPKDNCTEEVAQLRELVVKDITLGTGSKTVYQVAASQAFIGGYGAYRVATEYSHNKSFDLDIVLHYFKDATKCYWDLSAEKINKTDGMFAGYVTRHSWEKLKELVGEELMEEIKTDASICASPEDVAIAVDPQSLGSEFNWADGDGITIQHHFKRKLRKDTLYKLSNGSVYDKEEMDELIEESKEFSDQQMMMQRDEFNPMQEIGQEEEIEDEVDLEDGDIDERQTLYIDGEPVRILDKRDYDRYYVQYYKIAGDYILEETEFPSEQLPIVFVDQKSYYDKNGKQICLPFFKDAVDTQRYINYLRTQSAYVLKVSRYDQWIGSKKNVSSNDTQAIWRDPLTIQGMLTYDESPTGVKPERISPPEISQSLHTQYELAIQDLYTSTGLYPARMGEQGNETSGRAINARTRQGSYATYPAFNSINRAIAVGGEIINEMIPKVYDAERVISLMTPDEGQKNITLNKESDAYGAHIENDIRKGTFEVKLMPGASYEGQKQEALDSLKEVLAADPQAFALIADLYAENLPLMNNIEIKNRLKTMVSPQIIEAGKTGKSPQKSGQPSPQEQMMQQQQQMQQMEMQMKAQEIQIKQKELELKEQKIVMDAQLGLQKLETERLEVAGQLEEQKLRYAAEMDRTQSDAQMNHADNLVKILTHKIG